MTFTLKKLPPLPYDYGFDFAWAMVIREFNRQCSLSQARKPMRFNRNAIRRVKRIADRTIGSAMVALHTQLYTELKRQRTRKQI